MPHNFKKLLLALPLLVLTSISFAAPAHAWDHGRPRHREYHQPSHNSGGVLISLPRGFINVAIGRERYYYCEGRYYRHIPRRGYQVVIPPVPVIVESTVPDVTVVADRQQEIFTVNIPDSKGSYTGVNIKRSGSGFVGPQGEFYAEFPKVEQLKVMYGK